MHFITLENAAVDERTGLITEQEELEEINYDFDMKNNQRVDEYLGN